MNPPVPIECVGLADTIRGLVEPRASRAVASLELDRDIGCLRICADDVPGDDDAWYGLAPPRTAGRRQVLEIYCHQDSFGVLRTATSTVFPPRPTWEASPGPFAESVLEPSAFVTSRTDIFLHHHLLTARDLVRGEIDPDEVPAGLAESFAALWAVGVDGRLERADLPGYPMAERRGRFSRLFSSAGILMPEHWQAFQSLWDGILPGQRDVIGLVRRLPRL